MFVDRARITAKAGKGGDGCVSFLREKFRPRGGPDGGDGGDGGSVFIEATTHQVSLRHLASQVNYKAEHGRQGGNKKCSGRRGKSITLQVPPGTLVFRLAEGQDEPAEGAEPLADLTDQGQTVCLARGGVGGEGNAAFATALNQAPQTAVLGSQGESGRFHLELKLIAEVGIVGLPNAGKSTFIARVSAARPKIASYPFTTLVPNLGVARLNRDRSLVIADIPGLIEGASEGKGLGDDFLRHVERTRVLLHMLDVSSEEMGGPSPLEAYRTIRGELTRYRRAELDTRPEVVALNKIDTLLPEDVEERAAKLSEAIGVPVLTLSAVSGQGCDAVLDRLACVLAETEDVLP
jgi:GTP-binding protein